MFSFFFLFVDETLFFLRLVISLVNMSEETTTEKEKRKRRYPTTVYPKISLMETLKIAQAIKDHSAGKPYDRLDLAKTIGFSPASSKFRMMISSSNRYGLTKGNYNAKQIALTPLGTSIVSPKDSHERADGLKKALFNIDLFKRFFTDYDNNKLPDVQFLVNTLNRTYGIPVEDCKKCYSILVKNAKELKILDEISGSQWVHLSKLSVPEAPPAPPTPPTPEEGEVFETPAEPYQPPTAPPVEEEEKPIVFISHSKNETIVDQIKTILEFGQFDYRIAEETETTAIPIPEKVFGIMRDCNCAIINISADEQEKREDGTYGINPNVLTEIGGAFLLYKRKVILLVDKRVELPSNLQGLYRCEYEGDELAFSTYMKLQKALAEFRKT